MKQIPFSPCERRKRLGAVAEEFYMNILYDEQPLFVSDKATLWGMWMGDEQEIINRCSRYYGVPVSMDGTKQPFVEVGYCLERTSNSISTLSSRP